MSEHRHLLRSASVITAATILSRIFGFIRDSRVAFLLGAGTANDACTVAYRIPNLLRRLVGEGAVSAAFIPIFSRYVAEDRKKEAWEFANAMLTVITIVLACITVLGIIFPYIFLVSLSALTMGILNSLQRFGEPAFAPVLLNLSVIAFSFFGGFFGDVTKALAVGVVVGGVLQLAIQVPPLLRSGWPIRLKLDFSHPGVQRVTKLMVPVIFGVGGVLVNMLVDSQFASYLKEGSVTSLYIASRVMELALGSYAVAVSTVILPLLSRQAAGGRIDEMKGTLNFATRLILFITFPATAGLILLRHQIIEVLFQHGDFDAASTALTAWALLFFAPGLSAFSMVKVIVPAFYALQDTRTPVKIAFIAMFLNIGLNLLFIRPLQNGGPALATTASAFFNSLALLIIFRKRYGSFGLRCIANSVMKFVIASAALALVGYIVIHWPGLYAGRMTQKTIVLGLTIAAGTGTYFGTASLLRSRELAELREVRRSEQSGLD